MKILIIGSGGREHALAWKIAQSPLVSEICSAPGNPGMAELGSLYETDMSNTSLGALCEQIKPDLVVIGPEDPLANGLTDYLEGMGFKVFGPSKAGAQLESSKHFSKQMMQEANIPTADYAQFSETEPAIAYLDTLSPPYVIKADGLAAGKGVIIAGSKQEANRALSDMLSGQFGAASSSVLIEEFMQGEEASIFALSDGKDYIILPACQDHKRAFDGDKGPNTGGMGAYCPAPIVDSDLMKRIDKEIIFPSFKAMAERGTPYKGVLYIGVMIDADPLIPEVKRARVVEYNCRFGDPECQVLMQNFSDDIVPLLLACAEGRLAQIKAGYQQKTVHAPACHNAIIVMASKGYPGAYEKGTPISGLKQAAQIPAVQIFHAGTAMKDGQLTAYGGRVLGITAKGDTLDQALKRAYAGVDAVSWDQGFYRKDIGWRALKAGQS